MRPSLNSCCLLAFILGCAFGLLPMLPFAGAAEPTDWLHDAQWGVMTHYLGAPPSSKGGAELTAEVWNKQVDSFDVNGLADAPLAILAATSPQRAVRKAIYGR